MKQSPSEQQIKEQAEQVWEVLEMNIINTSFKGQVMPFLESAVIRGKLLVESPSEEELINFTRFILSESLQGYFDANNIKLTITKYLAELRAESPSEEPCPNCKETIKECACLRNKCMKCGASVGNITFTVCDKCWDEKHGAEPISVSLDELTNKIVNIVSRYQSSSSGNEALYCALQLIHDLGLKVESPSEEQNTQEMKQQLIFAEEIERQMQIRIDQLEQHREELIAKLMNAKDRVKELEKNSEVKDREIIRLYKEKTSHLNEKSNQTALANGIISKTGEDELLIYKSDGKEGFVNIIIDEDGRIELMHIPKDGKKTTNKVFATVDETIKFWNQFKLKETPAPNNPYGDVDQDELLRELIEEWRLGYMGNIKSKFTITRKKQSNQEKK
jgi:hypothetical protein